MLHHAGAQDAGSQPVESQVVLEDSEWILKDSEDPAISEQVFECASAKVLSLAAYLPLHMLLKAPLASRFQKLPKYSTSPVT
jgi:hypothetical protein